MKRQSYSELREKAESAEDSEYEAKLCAEVTQMGEAFEKYMNYIGADRAGLLADYLATMLHRTVQQSVMGFCMAYIRRQAEKTEGQYDARNEGTVLMSKFIVAKLKEAEKNGEYYGLPLI